jgi:hypothetical protein
VVKICLSLEANEQPPKLVQPGKGALDHPAKATEAGSVRSLAASDLRNDTASPELTAVAVRVVAAIGE